MTLQPNHNKWWRAFDIVAMIDPASGQESRNCETAIVTVGGLHRTERDEVYCLDARAGHWTIREALNQMFLVHGIYQPDHVGFEDIGAQVWLQTLSEICDDRPASFALKRHNSQIHGRKKRQRFEKAARHKHLWRFKRSDHYQTRLIDQLLTFTMGDKFDLGDAFCMAFNEYWRLFPLGKKRGEKPRFEYIYKHGQIVGHRAVA